MCPPYGEEANVLGHASHGQGRTRVPAMRGRVAFGSSLLAVCLAVGLLPAALWVPMYNDGGTLVGVNGPGVLVPVAIPFVLAAVAFAGLWLKCTRGSVAGERAAIVVLSILGVFTVLTGFSIGILVLPMTALVA